MLDRVAERVLPIVEDLAADDVPADAPEIAPALRVQPFVAEHLVVEIMDLERGVMEMRRRPLGEGDGMMVGEGGAAVAAQEGDEVPFFRPGTSEGSMPSVRVYQSNVR
jgi:hypothetical protein